jgi:cytochrome P450/glycosyltransferase involved in cell wall biosynthesis
MSAPRFSIVIPTYNYGRFLARAIDSVLVQRGDDYEIAVIDDGSTDDTPQVAASFGSRIRYFRQPHEGVFSACKHGLNVTRGQFLVYLDADDRLAPATLAVLRQRIEQQPELGLICGRHVNVAVASRRLSPPLHLCKSRSKNFVNFLRGRLEICTGAAAIRREAIDLLRCYHGGLRVGMEAACIAHTLWHFDAVAVNDVLLEVHDHPGRLRNNLVEIRSAGEQLVDAVFHSEILPPEAMRYRELFRARLLRDRARSYHKAGFHDESIKFFQQALRSDPVRTLSDVRNTRRYVISRWRRFASPQLPDVEKRDSREHGVVEVSGRHRAWGHRLHLQANAVEFLKRCSQFGDVVKLQLARPTYLLGNPSDIAHVFVDHPERFRRTGLQTGFRAVFGRGLFSRTGRSHIELRRLVQPLFHRARLDSFLPPLQKTLGEILPHWAAGQVVDVNDAMQDFTVCAAGRMILGIERAEDIAELFTAIQGSHQRVVRNMQAVLPVAEWLPTRRNRILRAHVARIDAIFRRLVNDVHARGPREDVLSRLLQLRDAEGAGLDITQVRDQVLSVFLAAYEPTATGLMWILRLLATHGDVQKKLQAEIDEHASTTDINATVESAMGFWQRPYASQVILEAMRLYPSTWLLARRTAEEDELPSGVRVRRGVDIFASPFLVHRDTRFYAEPEQFRPERFDKGSTELRAAGHYFPFGLGPSACLGEYLARLMMAVTINGILGRFDLEIVDSDAPPARSVNLFTMQPDRQIRLMLKRRSGSAALAAA